MIHGIKYDFNGKRHEISHEEVEAIERSGRSEWRQYRDCADDDEIHPTAWAKIAAMESRPGITESFDTAVERDGDSGPYVHFKYFERASKRIAVMPKMQLIGIKRLKVHVEGSRCPSMAKELVPNDMILTSMEFRKAHYTIQCQVCLNKYAFRSNSEKASDYVMSIKR